MPALSDCLVGRVVVCGVGCPGRGDDGFGPLLAQRLRDAPGVMALDCEDRLEDYTGDIARLRPDTVIIADAVDVGGTPGQVALAQAEALPPTAAGSHRPSLRVAMDYLRLRTGARVYLLGVQPAVVCDQDHLSPEVASSLERVTKALAARAVPRPVPPGLDVEDQP
jgi:hydrogenase 3 maturation protease